jgi:hypothetical protein
MKDLKDIRHEDFQPCLQGMFEVRVDDGNPVELELIEVKPFGEAASDGKTRQPFCLLFRGPLEPALPQQIHCLENPELGEISLFLVAVGPDEDGMLYDVTFN